MDQKIVNSIVNSDITVINYSFNKNEDHKIKKDQKPDGGLFDQTRGVWNPKFPRKEDRMSDVTSKLLLLTHSQSL